jgi:lysophospholipid acyltransferase (LPLAT)-like uncharacterized protein
MAMKLKQIIGSIPWLDEFRTETLASICAAGATFFDRSFAVTKFISPAAYEYLDSDKPAIFALYHGRLIGMLQIVEHREKLTALISRSRDGEFLARMAEKMGYGVARGSPAYKAVEGAKQLIDAARAGQSLVMAVDGPRGPIYEPKEGVIRMAELTGLPLLPFVCKGKKNHFFSGWDKMMGCYFGSPITYIIGDPIFVPSKLTDEERENYRQQLAASMHQLRENVDKYWQDNS